MKNLQQTDESLPVSDAQYIVEKFKAEGALCFSEVLNAEEFMSPVPRVRLWWAVMRSIPPEDHEAATVFFKSILGAFKCTDALKFTFPLDRFIVRSLATLQKIAAQCHLPLHSKFGIREPKTYTSDDKLEYKVAHKELSNIHKVTWPLKLADTPHSWSEEREGGSLKTPSKVFFNGMLPREREVAVWLDIKFPPEFSNLDGFEFCDLNPTLNRLIQNVFEQDGFGEQLKHPDASPWARRPPTLVGSAKMAVRYFDPEQAVGSNLCSESP